MALLAAAGAAAERYDNKKLAVFLKNMPWRPPGATAAGNTAKIRQTSREGRT